MKRACLRAVDEVATATCRLLDALVTSALPRDREAEAAKARARAAKRFGPAARTRNSSLSPSLENE